MNKHGKFNRLQQHLKMRTENIFMLAMRSMEACKCYPQCSDICKNDWM